MKRVFFLFLLLSAISRPMQAQWGDERSENFGTLKLSSGYTHDFPGLNGYSVVGEYSHSLCANLEGAFNVRRVQLSGYPRTASVNEFTKATTIEFAMYILPVQTERHILRIGAGFGFSFYKIRRTYPVFQNNGTEKIITWPVADAQGSRKGVSLTGEYEYVLPASNYSIGLRASLFKAYDQVSYVGPFVALKF